MKPEALVNILSNSDEPITTEMVNWYVQRTDRHVDLVQKYCRLIHDLMPERWDGLIEAGEEHDASKYQEPELGPYIALTWRYKAKDDGFEYKPSVDMEKRISEVTFHHIVNNAHHPEFSDPNASEDNLNPNDRHKNPDKAVDATRMSDLMVAEMVADWCAMSEERGNTPKEWADKTVNKRWMFTPAQTSLIYELIKSVWAS
jgi:hypothetical protein